MQNRYAVKFSKTGYIKYISHLDLLRVFKRSFSMAGLALKYSQGFNPHPKMSFAQPLSLGYSSNCELVEIETKLEHKPQEIVSRLNKVMPEGIEILDCFELDDRIKSLSGASESAEYLIKIPTELSDADLKKCLSDYMAQKEIIAMKKMKKTKQFEPVPIKQMIRKLGIEKSGESALLFAHLDSGSHSNLSPELVISTFIAFAGINAKRYECEVERLAMHFVNNLQF